MEANIVRLPSTIGNDRDSGIRSHVELVEIGIEIGDERIESCVLVQLLLVPAEASVLREPSGILVDDDGLVYVEDRLGKTVSESLRVGEGVANGFDTELRLGNNESVELGAAVSILQGSVNLLVLLDDTVCVLGEERFFGIWERDSIVALDNFGEGADAEGDNITLSNDDTLGVVLAK